MAYAGIADSRQHNKDIAKYLARASLLITQEEKNAEMIVMKKHRNLNTIDAIISHTKAKKTSQQ